MRTSKWIVVALAASIAGCESGLPTSAVESVPALPLSADARLDQADANVEKAIVLLGAAVNESPKNDSKPFGGHRTKAISLLEKARL
ncbi:MAG: hypothetical protein ACR2GQ_03795 [Gemmatimonadota bacterium]